jgi:hypothetical protein
MTSVPQRCLQPDHLAMNHFRRDIRMLRRAIGEKISRIITQRCWELLSRFFIF